MLSLQSKQKEAAQLLKLCTNTMVTIRTIEIDEVETEVLIDFEMYFGDIEINKTTNLETGDAIEVEIDNNLYNDLLEMAADYKAEKGRSKYNFNY